MNQQQHPYSALQNEISQWEHAISVQTDCADPLEIHYQYICWLESHLKTHQSLDERFKKAIEASLTIFDKHDQYKQDLRLVKLWIKYVSNLHHLRHRIQHVSIFIIMNHRMSSLHSHSL